jgi:hypothetical protein
MKLGYLMCYYDLVHVQVYVTSAGAAPLFHVHGMTQHGAYLDLRKLEYGLFGEIKKHASLTH